MNRTKANKIITAIMIAVVSLTAAFSILTVSSVAVVKADAVRAIYTLPDAVTRGIKKESIRQRVAQSIKRRLEDHVVVQIYGQVNKHGKLAEPVTRDIMHEEIIKATGVSVVKSDLPEYFDSWGFYYVEVKIYDNITASVRIEILPPNDYEGKIVYPNAAMEMEMYKRHFLQLRKEGKSTMEANRIMRRREINLLLQKKEDSAAEFHEEMEIEEAKKQKEELEDKRVKIYARAGVNGKIFSSVTLKEIADAIERTYGIRVDKRTIEPRNLEIRTFGTYDIKVRLHEEVSSSMKVEVLQEIN